ncbi:hypothetical protein B0A52_06979 [Exophiala mesophila]|uniref:Uncharacterized protein n=1 Tax=Exophiala mesophila TaxID=212818 RepID=A0A438N1F0_EXOME|nr:hypothetical protein B0A52_06979 [Exophiala mesophila]
MPPRRRSAKGNATPTSATSHKRRISETPTTAASNTPGSRVSKRLKDSAHNQAKATPTKSKYFEGAGTDDEDDAESVDDDSGDPGYEDEQASTADASDTNASDDEDEDDYDSDEKPRAQKKKGPARSSGANAKDLWRPGVKTGLGPGREVFIEKPKPRDDGGIKYEPGKIHPNTMEFLRDLKKNNDREWLKMHDPDYRTSWKDWESFVEILTEKISEIDETIPELPPKDLVFRIYRDVRFSSDPTPYKARRPPCHSLSRTGRKGPYACYYVQIQPGGKSLVGAGLWMPEAQPLARLRSNIDRRPEQIRSVLNAPLMRKHILGGIPADEKKAVKAFAAQNTENALKTKPKASLACLSGQLAQTWRLPISRLSVKIISHTYRQTDGCHLPGLACVTIRQTLAREDRHHVDQESLGPTTAWQWVRHMGCTDNTSGA